MVVIVVLGILYFNSFKNKIDRVVKVNNAKIEQSIIVRNAMGDITYDAGIIAAR